MASMWAIRLFAGLAIVAMSASTAWAQQAGEVQGPAESGGPVDTSPEPAPAETPTSAATPIPSPTSAPDTAVAATERSPSPPIPRRDPRLPGEFSWAIGLAPLPGLDLTGMVTRRAAIHGLVMGLPILAYLLEVGPRYYFSLHRTTGYIEGGVMYGSFSTIFSDERVSGVAGSVALGVEHQFRSRMTISAAGGVYFRSEAVPLLRLMFGYRF